jgi:hypothetical protein
LSVEVLARSRVVREEPETERERAGAMYRYQSAGHDSVQPPRQNAPMTPTRPGQYRFLDAIGAPPQVIQLVEVAGELLAVFPPQDGNRGAKIPVADMHGTISPAADS